MKFLVGVNGCRRNIADNLNRLSREHEHYRQTDRQRDRQTDRRQTDGRAIAYSERSLKMMGQQRLDSLSVLCVEADMLRSVFFEDVIKDFAFAKSRKRTFLNCVLYCNCKCMQRGCKRDLSL